MFGMGNMCAITNCNFFFQFFSFFATKLKSAKKCIKIISFYFGERRTHKVFCVVVVIKVKKLVTNKQKRKKKNYFSLLQFSLFASIWHSRVVLVEFDWLCVQLKLILIFTRFTVLELQLQLQIIHTAMSEREAIST